MPTVRAVYGRDASKCNRTIADRVTAMVPSNRALTPTEAGGQTEAR